jgi:hypothetical protein
MMIRAAEQLADQDPGCPPSSALDQQATMHQTGSQHGRDILALSSSMSRSSGSTSMQQEIQTIGTAESMKRDQCYEPKYEHSIPQDVPVGSPISSVNSSVTQGLGGLPESPKRAPSLNAPQLDSLPCSPSAIMRKHLYARGNFSRIMSPLGMNSRHLKHSGSFAQHGEGWPDAESSVRRRTVASGEISMVSDPCRAQVCIQTGLAESKQAKSSDLLQGSSTGPSKTQVRIQTGLAESKQAESSDLLQGSSTGPSRTAKSWEDRIMGNRVS